MKVNISPEKFNTYPKKGILIKGKSPNMWLPILQQLNIDLIETAVYPVPSKIANELYGCFIVIDKFNDVLKQLNVGVFQIVNEYIYIPEYSKISPKLTKEDAQTIFKSPHVFHPDFGWVALSEAIVWEELLQLEKLQEVLVVKPAKMVFTPNTIKSFQLITTKEIDIIKELNLTVEPPKKDVLSNLEKVKLKLFKTVFSSKKNEKGRFDIEGKGFFKWLNKNTSSNIKNEKSKLEKDFEKLLYRNQKETDKLLSLFKSNPHLALSRAIPLDLLGTSRDEEGGVFKVFRATEGEGKSSFFKLVINLLTVFVVVSIVFLVYSLLKGVATGTISDFFFTLLKVVGVFVITIIILSISESFAGKAKGAGKSSSIDSERMAALRKEYEKLAEEAITNKEYKKGASIYMKLLKDNYKGAKALEDGKFYHEAAVVHLKFNKNKEYAAKAYENGKFYNKAINLYKELNKNEKVGDLYKLVDNKKEADKHFQVVVDDYLNKSQYVKASLLYKSKMEDTDKAKEILLRGWQEKKDAYNCLNNYFSNFSNEKSLKESIHFIYEEETDNTNSNDFLKALKIAHNKHEEIQDFTQNIAYEVVAKYIKENPSIAFSLSSFNGDNSLLNTDTSKFVKNEKKRKRANRV